MNGEERRKMIRDLLAKSSTPLSGGALSARLGVSRQVVVQDMALLRAEGCEIVSTNRGYILRANPGVERVFYVQHDNSRIVEELNLIVDNGGKVLDVFVRHEVYGELKADLGVDSRKKAAEFMKEIENGSSSPLNTITSGYHYHTVAAESTEILDAIEKELDIHGFLVKEDH